MILLSGFLAAPGVNWYGVVPMTRWAPFSARDLPAYPVNRERHPSPRKSAPMGLHGHDFGRRETPGDRSAARIYRSIVRAGVIAYQSGTCGWGTLTRSPFARTFVRLCGWGTGIRARTDRVAWQLPFSYRPDPAPNTVALWTNRRGRAGSGCSECRRHSSRAESQRCGAACAR